MFHPLPERAKALLAIASHDKIEPVDVHSDDFDGAIAANLTVDSTGILEEKAHIAQAEIKV